MPSSGGGGCNATPGSPAVLIMVLGSFVVLRRRRR